MWLLEDEYVNVLAGPRCGGGNAPELLQGDRCEEAADDCRCGARRVLGC